jgi:hypothetical protein
MKLQHPIKAKFHNEYQDLRDAGADMCEAIESIAQANQITIMEVLHDPYAEVEAA